MRSKGFTAVEMVVVISLIGILSMIIITQYQGWVKRTAQKEVQSDLISAAAAMEAARNFSNGYPLSLPTTFKKSPGVNVTYKAGGTATAYCLDGTSTKDSSVDYYISSAGTKTPTAGMCP